MPIKNLRRYISKRIVQSEIPILVYVVILGSMAVLWWWRRYNEDLAMNFFAELFGAAFTLFIIDVLLVRSKTSRWKTVREDINYLIARSVNRLRDGISIRAFMFDPELREGLSQKEAQEQIREKRTALLLKIESLSDNEILSTFNEKELFTESSYEYFHEKADEVWRILNIRYADYLHPDLVSLLLDLHIELKDLDGHIRQYLKSKRFPKDASFYQGLGKKGAAYNLSRIIRLLNRLKQAGYSEIADTSK
ncbi:MAG: hypothetical protein EA341_13510 [Mongoliibacter sp.]|uniref:hypothetical protein n=1 Tax=Mongoliibacter sp. TaxID=2022438 RepID=UPI0012F304CA|nr:hypothetical protein [Mongoliibacter sp.]TVP46596.1 MAG: hypothetical protein EA341_13510 [Mongoliibacter sp.]